MLDQIENPRYLCSELVSILYEDRFGATRHLTGNLEMISSSKATVLAGRKLERGRPVTFCAKGRDLYGVVTSTSRDAVLGWFVEIELDRSSRWSGRLFVPEHFLALCVSASGLESTASSKVFTRRKASGS